MELCKACIVWCRSIELFRSTPTGSSQENPTATSLDRSTLVRQPLDSVPSFDDVHQRHARYFSYTSPELPVTRRDDVTPVRRDPLDEAVICVGARMRAGEPFEARVTGYPARCVNDSQRVAGRGASRVAIEETQVLTSKPPDTDVLASLIRPLHNPLRRVCLCHIPVPEQGWGAKGEELVSIQCP